MMRSRGFAKPVLLVAMIAITVSTLALVLVHPSAWPRLGREDGVVEIAGAVAFLLLSAMAVMRFFRSPWGARAPSLAAIFAGIFGAGEEISWGQRLFDIEPPSFFLRHNVQGETNIHNLLSPPWDAVLAVVLILGFCLSPLLRNRAWVRQLSRRGVPWPRAHHAAVLGGCLAATVLVAAVSGVKDLEEVAELLFVLAVAATWSSDED